MKTPLRLSPEFVTELEQVYASLGMEPEVDLHFLAEQFTAWRRRTQELLHEYSAGLSKYDPLLCPISLFRTMDYGRLETAHTRTLAWLLDPKKEHGFGDKLLAALLRRLDGAEQFDALRDLHLASEYPTEATGTKGRLDVLAEGEWVVGHSAPVRWVLAIEA